MLLFATRMCVYMCVCYHVCVRMRVGLHVYVLLFIDRDYLIFILSV
jgi:hypothetical protein